MQKVSTHQGLSDFSPEIIRYILNDIPPYIGLVVLHTDAEGILLQCFGPVEKYFGKKPEKNNPIDAFTGIFTGMLPPLISPMVMPHVKINDQQYVEIHLLADEKQHNWIFMVDQTRQVELIQPIIQMYNEEKLNKASDVRQSAYKGTLSALYLLDYMSFEVTGKGYRLLGLAPEWFASLQKKLVHKNKLIALQETFPYLEVFEYETASLWSSNKDGKLISGVWEEEPTTGGKLYLQALALRHENRNYLLIKPLSNQSDIEEGFIQKAREQKLTLDQLAVAEKKLKQLLGFKNQFVSIISHDLRSPIGAVIGLTELLLSDNELPEKLHPSQLELLRDIQNEMHRLLDYNDKLFQWSNLELGNFRVTKARISARNLGNYIERMQAAKLRQKEIKLEIEAQSDFNFDGDETLMGQALNNLVGNSVKFTPTGGTIRLKFIENANQKMIQVEDSGIGMDQQTMDQLFTEFTRKTTPGTYGEKGTGLGLGIVKKILDAHGYQIRVESEQGKGSRFIILLQPS